MAEFVYQMIKARNGKYYWYVPINDIKFSQDRMAIGVAVADSPEGPWKDALGKPLVSDSVEMTTWNITNIDQTVSQTNAVGSSYLFPSEIIAPRIIRVGLAINF